MCEADADVTQLLSEWGNDHHEVEGLLFPLVYAELRKIARAHLRRERRDHTLQPTALVNEAYLRLVDQERVEWNGRAHFFGIASQMMRRILVDHARRRNAVRRGAGAHKVTFDEAVAAGDDGEVDLVALDDALERLASLDPEQGRLVELRFFGGLTIEETAEVMGTSPATVKREWAIARAWLFRELEPA
ncbi:MAG: sigma-70 family RNA polymerase sigma factor [Acidobacteriota bacterium]|jgi:RNA polymerase sigma factor (TIGR02999 family)